MNSASVAARIAQCVVLAFVLAGVACVLLVSDHVSVAHVAALVAVDAVVLAAMLAVLWSLRRWVLRTQAEIQLQIEAISEGRFEERQQSGAAEWSALTRTLNVMVVRVAAQIADRDRRLGELHAEVSVDELTGLSSRGQFMERLGAVLHEPGNASGGVTLLRIDDLTGLNQRAGRERTDDLLKAVATLLRTRALRLQREGVLVARLNGADFALLAPAVSAEAVDTWVRELADGLHQLKQQQLTDRPRVGWIAASAFQRGETIGAVMSRVDRALQASEANNTAWQVMGAARAKAVIPLAQWRPVIDDALATGRADLEFFDLVRADGSLHHRQALLRLTLADGRVLDHDDVLPAALRTGRVADVDLRAAELAIAYLVANTDEADDVAVKVSSQSAHRPSFISRLDTALTAAGREARRLWVQIDGSGEANLVALLAPLAAMLQRHGVHLGLDQVHVLPEDPAALRRLGIDFLKLATSACHGLAGDGGNGKRRLLQLLVEIGHSEGLEVMAGEPGAAADLRLAAELGVSCVPAVAEAAPAAAPLLKPAPTAATATS